MTATASASRNPLFGPNRLKLGTFGTNGPGISFTHAPELFRPTWANSLRMARLADTAGLEAIVPYARWHPFGGPMHATGRTLETFTWASAVGAVTRHACVMATAHVPAFHPVVAAKQAMTVDHVTGGRFALNVVCGWLPPEMAMFNSRVLDPVERYAYAAEWTRAIVHLWTHDEPLTFKGRYIETDGAVAQPKPLQRPHPPIMSAGNSEQGRAFAARHADIAFVMPREMRPAVIRAQVEEYREQAQRDHGRTLQVWMHAIVVARATRRAATAYLDWAVGEAGDREGADTFIRSYVPEFDRMPNAAQAAVRRTVMAGAGGAQLCGNADDITEDLAMLSDAGVDGVLLGWIDYLAGIEHFTAEVLPRLERGRLRYPFAPA